MHIFSLRQTVISLLKAQSGYYVTDIATKQHPVILEKHSENMVPCLYDFASSGVDRESFRFDLWQRYITSALRQDNRMLSYGEPQGEKISRRFFQIISGNGEM